MEIYKIFTYCFGGNIISALIVGSFANYINKTSIALLFPIGYFIGFGICYLMFLTERKGGKN